MKIRIGMKECAIMGILVSAALLLFYKNNYWKDGGEQQPVLTVSGKLKEVKRTDKIDKTDKTDKGKVAITFDDGPHPSYTEQLLDGLKNRKVKATFFVTGAHAELHPAIVKRMSEEGHLVGNHTYSHMQLKTSNKEEFKNELIKTNEIITGITGEEVLYVRPPYGTWDKKFETELNMFPVLWNVEAIELKIRGKKSLNKQEKILIQTLQVAY